MKKYVAILMVAVMLLALAACQAPTNEAKDKFVVGVCQLVQHPALDAATKGFVETLKAEFGDNIEILEKNASNDIPTCSTIVNDFVTKNVDLIMANATPALQAAAQATDEIPILGTSVTEYGVALGIDNFSGLVGTNVSGTSDQIGRAHV